MESQTSPPISTIIQIQFQAVKDSADMAMPPHPYKKKERRKTRDRPTRNRDPIPSQIEKRSQSVAPAACTPAICLATDSHHPRVLKRQSPHSLTEEKYLKKKHRQDAAPHPTRAIRVAQEEKPTTPPVCISFVLFSLFSIAFCLPKWATCVPPAGHWLVTSITHTHTHTHARTHPHTHKHTGCGVPPAPARNSGRESPFHLFSYYSFPFYVRLPPAEVNQSLSFTLNVSNSNNSSSSSSNNNNKSV